MSDHVHMLVMIPPKYSVSAVIRKYIREQDQRDLMLDKMTSKEYIDPFRPKQGKLL